jgi:glutamine amidotransferase
MSVCELFGMSSRLPTNVTFSLAVFGERGGRIGPHKDGWGIAFNEGKDFRIIKEAAPASNSACLLFIEGHDFKSQIVISHIRRATAATAASFTNTHPFARELYGFTHVFAHNGDVPGVFTGGFEPRYYYPQGETDSERAFCALMDRLRAVLSPENALNLLMKLPVIEDWALEVSKFGIFNFLLSDSRYLYAHRSTQLFYVQRECVSQSECLKSEELTIRLAQAANGLQRVVAIATEPLTSDEGWQPLPEARVAAFLHGETTY